MQLSLKAAAKFDRRAVGQETDASSIRMDLGNCLQASESMGLNWANYEHSAESACPPSPDGLQWPENNGHERRR